MAHTRQICKDADQQGPGRRGVDGDITPECVAFGGEDMGMTCGVVNTAAGTWEKNEEVEVVCIPQ